MAFDPISAAFEVGGKIIDRLWPDPSTKAQAQLDLLKMQQDGRLAELTANTEIAKGQLAINEEEAKNENVFVSGWRPFIGWTCGGAYAYNFVLQPFLIFILRANGNMVIPPSLDMGELGFVLAGMLGLGGMRTYEKKKGVA